MTTEFNREGPKWPTEADAVKNLEREIELGKLREYLSSFFPGRLAIW